MAARGEHPLSLAHRPRPEPSFPLRTVALAAVAFLFVVGCAASQSPSVQSGAGEDFAQSQAWQDEGKTLISYKATASASPDGTPLDSGAWAYQSGPVDLVKDGEYTFNFTVPVDFTVLPSASQDVHGVSFAFPPDMSFKIHPSSGWTEAILQNGTRTLSVSFSVSGLESTYSGFSVWIY